MLIFIAIIIYIFVGIFLNYKYNREMISFCLQTFPILSKIIITCLVILWPAIICARIENYFINKNER